MRVQIVHLSDIHFRKAGNPVVQVLDQLVQAVNSADPSASLILVVVSGDIAQSGQPAEYRVALQFFGDFNQRLKALRPDARIEYVCVPGNHDCVLPESGTKLRETLVQGVIPSMQDRKQDKALLAQLTKAQAPYSKFRKQLGKAGPWNGICQTVTIDHAGKKIQLNLYNTALLSQRDERQGLLHLPVRTFEEQISLARDSALSISVFHHSYLWLESNVAVDFRNHIEKTSDIALSGHQHYAHNFYKENSTGERILYIEAGALQDEYFPRKSAFQVLLFDWEGQQERSIKFRRSRDLYRPVDETQWRPVTLNRVIRAEFHFSDKFESALNETGAPLWHPTKGFLKLRDTFVFPDVLLRLAGTKPGVREVRGEELLSYTAKASRVVFQGSGLSGKTSLAKMLVWESFRRGGGVVPILLDGRQLTSPGEQKVLSDIWRAFSEEYSREMLAEFQQLVKQDRVLVIDDWHKAALNHEGRREFLQIVGSRFGRVILFIDELFEIKELISNPADTILEFDHAMLREFGHRLRGRLIDRWVTLGREYTGDSRKMSREIEHKERLIRSVIGKNTLPSHPFIVLSLLQAEEEHKAEAAEAGSFGYLYEVLVTVALSHSRGPKAQLEKKYTFLARLAYQMFKRRTGTLPLSQVRKIAEEYSRSHLVTVDIDSMLSDLEESRVLLNIDGNYLFAYPHLFY